MRLIVGLGNPGQRYVGTRHNVGFEVIDALARRASIAMTTEKFSAFFGDGVLAGEKVVLLKPTTFMNRSGRSVLAAGRFYKLDISELLVISDDLALPVGRIRMRAEGSSGNHKGLADIINRLGTNEFCRLRVGIGESIGQTTDYVLGRFSQDEETIMARAHQWAADAVESWIQNGVESTMSRYNGDPPRS